MKQGFLISTDECSKPYTFVICEPGEVLEILSKRSELEFDELEDSEILKLSSGQSVTVLGTCDGYREDEEEEDEYTFEQGITITPYEMIAEDGDKLLHVHVSHGVDDDFFIMGQQHLCLTDILDEYIPRVSDFSFLCDLETQVSVSYTERTNGKTIANIHVTKMELDVNPGLGDLFVQAKTLNLDLGIFKADWSMHKRILERIEELGDDGLGYSTEQVVIR